MAMNLKDYNQDEAYKLAAQRIGYGQEAPTYQGTYENQLNDIYDKIANREKFSYDVNADPLYNMYKDKYIQGGKLAMKDTMGQAAALTGGYGNTYGQQVGQQAYDAYLQNLSAVIPELYGMAYQKYKDEGDDLKDLYGLVGNRRDIEYGQWRDLMNDYNVNRNLVQQQEATDYARLLTDYERDQNEEQKAYDRAQDDYKKQQQAYANMLAMIQASGYIPTDEELAAAGLTRAAADAMRDEYLRQVALQGGTTYGSGGVSYGGSPSSSGGGKSSSGSRSSGGGGGGSSNDGYVTILPQGMNPGDYYSMVKSGTVTDAAAAAARNAIATSAAQKSALGLTSLSTKEAKGTSGSYRENDAGKVAKDATGTYNLGELATLAAAGANAEGIIQALKSNGVNVNDRAVQQDIKWALSK